ncbi:MAG: carboxysome shell protein [Gammaproteobacteria bacterium]|nr:carboxysome shell protein [Gammaproteobacteria bacterium]
MAQSATNQSTRQLVLERRRAMSTTGKAALAANTAQATTTSRTRTTATASPVSAVSYSSAARTPASSGRAASLARRLAMSSSGKAGIQSKDRTRGANDKTTQSAVAPVPTPVSATQKKGCGCGCDGTRAECKTRMTKTTAPIMKTSVNSKRQTINRPLGRIASLARREALSSRGKAGISKNGMSVAQTARAGNPNLSGRDLSKALREQRSKNGAAGQKKSQPSGRRRPKASADTGAAQDAPWKVGASETVQGQTVTGTMVGRSQSVTGDEPSTCRGITGTEYLGADIFRDFCQADPKASPGKVTVTTTSHGNAVSGNRIGRGTNVTGDEPGTCKLVTGNEYMTAEQSQAYCGEFLTESPAKVGLTETSKGKAMTGTRVGRSEKVTGDESGMSRALTGTQYTAPSEIGSAPAKVGVSTTVRGGSVTGTTVGRRERMTGDEPGSCRDITGDDYVGQEQFSTFCNTSPAPQDRKVGVSATGKGKTVTGTMTDRDSKVTGNEPGTCKAITGTPYAGAESTGNFCPAEVAAVANMRNKQSRSTPAMPLTGIQPGIGGTMTGDGKGACEPVSGTPYVGADQYAEVCPATPADTASADFPQALAGSAPWQEFSVTSPSGGAQQALGPSGITGSQYEQGHITGPFGMATGKVTGTEEARFGNGPAIAEPSPVVAEEVEGRTKSRITGEGQDAGLKITGDDWDRGNHVTGTEGVSAKGRNPTIRVSPAAAMAVVQKRNEEVPVPSSKVTGGSGNTERGSLITYSGGARG